MNTSLESTSTDLSDGAMLRLVDRRGDRIAVLSGRVWITQDSDPRDLVLEAGQSFELDRDGLAILQSFGASRVRVEGQAPAKGHLDHGAARERARIDDPGPAVMRTPYSALTLYSEARRERDERVAHGLFRLGRALADGFEQLSLQIYRRKSALLAQGRSVQC